MPTNKMKAHHVLFLKTFILWVVEMRVRYNCCLHHMLASAERVIEMTEMSDKLIKDAASNAITEDEFCKGMTCCIQEMENEMKTLKKAAKIENSDAPLLLQKEARA